MSVIETVLQVREKRQIVAGLHVTACSYAHLSVKPVDNDSVELQFGDKSQYLAADDLRELAALFTDMADILDGEDDE